MIGVKMGEEDLDSAKLPRSVIWRWVRRRTRTATFLLHDE
jgi:hypothetical protein